MTSILVPHARILALKLDGKGGAETLQSGWPFTDSATWLHLDYSAPEAYQWLKTTTLLPEEVRESLQGESNRPKLVKVDGGLLLTLRCLYHHRRGQSAQMEAIRIFVTPQLIISTRRRHIQAAEEIVQDLARHAGPLNCADWLVELCEHITEQAGDLLDDFQEQITALEQDLLAERTIERSELTAIRQQLIVLRRYLGPQRDLFSRLANEKISWLEADDQRHLGEIAGRLGRWLDDLDASSARCALLADELHARTAEQMTRRTYIMSMLAMVFLPATFLTGLFGVNLGGIPGGQSTQGFITFVLILLGLIVALGTWLWRHRWL